MPKKKVYVPSIFKLKRQFYIFAREDKGASKEKKKD